MSTLTDTFTGIANAIRSKTGSSSAFTPAQMITEIENIPTGGGSIIGINQYRSSNISAYEGNEIAICDDAFEGCSTLTTVSFPACTVINYAAFARCSALTTISFPACTTIGSYAFSTCYALTTASFPACIDISSYAFRYCSKLISLYLMGSSIPSLSSTNAFNSTPISGTGSGKIYVPSSLYNSYLTAAKWSDYSSHFVSM